MMHVRMKRGLITGMVSILLLSLLMISVSASPVLPAEYYGAITINGNPAPIGTKIDVSINGAVVGSLTTTTSGFYGGSGTFDPRLTATGSADGQTLTFLINGKTADQTSAFHPGKTQQLDLSATIASQATATPTKTTTTVAVTTTAVQQSETTAPAATTTSPRGTVTTTGTIQPAVTTKKTQVQQNNPVETITVTYVPTKAGEQKGTQATVSSTPVEQSKVPQPATTQTSGFTIQTLVLSLLVITGLAIIRK